MFSSFVNGQVDPLGLEKSGPILSTPILISEHMVLPLGHCYMRMFPFAICEVGFSFFLGEYHSTLNVGSADVFSWMDCTTTRVVLPLYLGSLVPPQVER